MSGWKKRKGFSGGEKKKAEILQMLMLEPKLAILDETDSGLDVDAVRTVSEGVRLFRERTHGSLLIITHSTRILEAIHGVLERTPPELVADISTNGIVMTGGGSLVWGFDKLIESHTGIETHVADDAISCVAYGTGKSLENVSDMQDGTINLSRRKQMN